MSRFPPLALASFLGIVGVVLLETTHHVTSVGTVTCRILPAVSAFQAPRQKASSNVVTAGIGSTASTTCRTGSSIRLQAVGSRGDIGDNLYLDSPSSRARSSTYQSLFSDQATAPVDDALRAAGYTYSNGYSTGISNTNSLFNSNKSVTGRVRLSDVGKPNGERRQMATQPGMQRSLQKQIETQQKLEQQRRAREERERYRREKEIAKQNERQMKQFAQREKQERSRREARRERAKREREAKQLDRSQNVRLSDNYYYGNNYNVNRYSNVYYSNDYSSSSLGILGEFGKLNSPLWHGGFKSPERNYVASNSNRFNGINSVGDSENRVRLSDIGKYDGRNYNGRNARSGSARLSDLGKAYDNGNSFGGSRTASTGRSGSSVRLSDLGKEYTDSFDGISTVGRAGGFRVNTNNSRSSWSSPRNYVDTDYYYSNRDNSDVWGGRWKGTTENSLINLVPYGVGKHFGNARDNPHVYSDSVNNNYYRDGSYRRTKPTLVEKAKMLTEKTMLKADIKKLENKIESRKKKLGVDTYEYRQQLSQEYNRFVDDLRRRNVYYDEREIDDRIARYTKQMRREQDNRTERLNEAAQRDIDILLNQIKRKEEEVMEIEVAENGGVRDPRRDTWRRTYSYNDDRRGVVNRLG